MLYGKTFGFMKVLLAGCLSFQLNVELNLPLIDFVYTYLQYVHSTAQFKIDNVCMELLHGWIHF